MICTWGPLARSNLALGSSWKTLPNTAGWGGTMKEVYPMRVLLVWQQLQKLK